MRTFQTQSQACRTRLLAVLIIGIAVVAAVGFRRWHLVWDIYLTDVKNMVLNGAILVLFALGIGHLIRAFGRYDFEEKQVAKFIQRIQTGIPEKDWRDAAAPPVHHRPALCRDRRPVRTAGPHSPGSPIGHHLLFATTARFCPC